MSKSIPTEESLEQTVNKSQFDSIVKQAREKGIKAGLLRLITIWPFPEELISKHAKQVKVIIVPEMNYGQIVREVERSAKETPVVFIPKLGEDPHKPSEILDTIRRFL